ncbi:hypothetical protein ACNS7O_04180 [Haloferacaceae archaeon DSL9]
MDEDAGRSETDAFVWDTIATGAELPEEIDEIRLTPSEHQRIKDLVNGEEMRRLKGHDRRYLIVGAGGATGAATRRMMVYDLLDERDGAVATRLEDFGLTPDDIALWTRAFDILCGRATHIVGVLEDFDGGYVWELGLLFAPSYRQKVWVVKRRYADDEIERDRFDNGMAASHVTLLLTGERCLEWRDESDLRDAVDTLP